MTELGVIFAELGISHYLHDFIDQGFDTWETILDIKESDFDALGVKLGHRRKLQRKIANSRGLSSDRALESPNTPNDDRQAEEQKASIAKADAKDGGNPPQGAKRKYRRHPKPDENSPERPPSAYVIFSNKMREDLKGRNLSFTEIAKLVGENWQNLSPTEKEPFEQQAFTAKEKYNSELTEYKKTDNYREYSQYLAEFKARQSNQQPVTDLDSSKRPKLGNHQSTGGASNGTSSGASQHGVDTPSSGRTDSASNNGHWSHADGQPSPQSSTMPKLTAGIGALKGHGSPATTSPTVLPGYRESIFGVGQTQSQQLPWRDGPRDDGAASLHQFSRMANVNDRRLSHPGIPVPETRNLTGSIQHAHRTGQTLPPSHPPPLLTSESTNRSSVSSTSTGSSAFFTPRTPMEPPLERAPLPSLYSQNSTGSYDNQLPPLRPPSLSPQITLHGSQQSPKGIHQIMDFPPTIAPLRGYNGPPRPNHAQVDERQRDYMASNPGDDNLDPVSALLKAGEIVNRNSRGRS